MSESNLSTTVEKQIEEFKWLKNLNQSLGISLGLLGILVSLIATGLGIAEKPKFAAGFAAAGAAVQAILFAYPVDKRASFYRLLLAKSHALHLDLKFEKIDARQKEKLEELKNLLITAANEEPQGDLSESISFMSPYHLTV